MAKKVSIPESLKNLLPENLAEPVVIGSEAFELLPLTEGMCEKISAIIADIATKIYQSNADASVANSVAEVLLKDGGIRKVLSVVLDEQEEYLQKNLTVQQAIHICGTIYSQNFSLDKMEEGSRKNVEKLLSMLGLREEKKDDSDLRKNLSLLVKIDPSGPYNVQQILSVLAGNSPLSSYMNSSPAPMDGQENTFKDVGSASAKSPGGSAILNNGGSNTPSSPPSPGSGRKFSATAEQIAKYRESKLKLVKPSTDGAASPAKEESASGTN